jgi:DNA-binding MarR family transcriptional regulator
VVAVIEAAKPFTIVQGQYLTFIYYYTKIHGTALAEADFQRSFRVTAPVLHQMIMTLEAPGFIDREPGRPPSRSTRYRLTPRPATPSASTIPQKESGTSTSRRSRSPKASGRSA